MRVAVMTMVRNEAAMLPRWVGYYGSQVGHENLYVFDDQSDDGSTTGIDATVLRLPVRAAQIGRDFSPFKAAVGSKFARMLLIMYDAVIFTDVDEFIVADPRRHDSLVDFVASVQDDVVAPIGLNVLHSPSSAPPLDSQRPLLQQRRHVKLAPFMCKPVIARTATTWGPGQHGCMHEYRIHREAFLVHAHYADMARALQAQEERHDVFRLEASDKTSMWSVSPERLATIVAGWTAHDDDEPATFDPSTIDLDGIVRPRPKRGGFTSRGLSNDNYPLMSLPPYLADQV